MEIKTQFNVGDTIYYIDTEETRIKSITVSYVTTYCNGERTAICYHPEDSLRGVDEDKAFPSREALINHLSKE